MSTKPVQGVPVEPRLETLVRDSAGSYGDEVCDWALKFLNVEVMGWQRHILRQLLSYDAEGRWSNQKALVSVARQNGKTVLMKAVLGWYLTQYLASEKQPQTVISTAHDLSLAVSLFTDLAPTLAEKFGAKVKRSYGRNELQIGPHKWIVRAATHNAGHGQSTALLLVDECWGVSQDALDVGLLPTQRAQANPLCIMLSTAGVEGSTAMLRWREQGLRGIDEGIDTGIYFAEYSPDPALDPMTPEAWRMANPALGTTISEETLIAESMSPNRAAFLRSSCNLWVQSDVGWLAPGQWAAGNKGNMPLPGGVLAAEISVDNGRYCAVRVNKTAGGELCATVEFIADTMTQTWQLLEQAAKDPALVIAVTPTLDINCPLHLKRRRVIWGYQEVTRYTAAVRQMIIEGRIEHDGSKMLAEHIGRAVAARTAGSIALSSQRSNGPIELARCLVAAVGFAIGQRATAKPMIVTTTPRRTA
jgi:phage terminase large subunit-like protein